MRSTYLFICSLLLFGVALSARHFIPLESASDSTFTGAPFPAIIAAKGNMAVTASTIGNSVSLFKRNSAGYYDLIGNVSVPGTPYQISTDGTWISVSILFEYKSFLFQIDDNGQKTNLLEIPSELDLANLIAPNTLAVINSTYIKTYEYNGGKWLLVDESAFGTPGDLYVNIGKEIYRITENTFAGTYQYQSQKFGFLMQRQADKSWTLFDTYNISMVGDDPALSAWNGNDTVVVTFPGDRVISVHVREGPGQWSEQFFYSWELGYSIQSQLGHAALVIDSNNFLISAPYHMYASDGSAGAALLMHRESAAAQWDFSLEFGRFSFRQVQFGFGLVSNDHDLLVYSCRIPPEGSNAYNCTFFTHPSCFLDTIDVTCASPAELAQCNSLAVADVFTLNNPQCGHVSHTVPEFNWSDEDVQFNVTFARALVPEVTCAISMMCPAAPVANIPVTSPSPTPVPVTSSTPIAVPAAKVSSTASVVFSTAALYVVICNAFVTLVA